VTDDLQADFWRNDEMVVANSFWAYLFLHAQAGLPACPGKMLFGRTTTEPTLTLALAINPINPIGSVPLTGTAGNDILSGGAGTDTAVFPGNRASYTISKISTGWNVSSTADEVDTLTNIERLKFADTAIALDTSGVSGRTIQVYKAACNRTPDLGELGFWISGMDGGISLNAVAQGFVN
jgi:hypothetical protein